MTHLLRALDSVDACIFSGNSLEDASNRQELRTHIERWTRALVEREFSSAELVRMNEEYRHAHMMRDNQAWDRAAERLTAKALGTDQGRINMQAKSIDDIFFEACAKCKNTERCAQRGSCIDRDALAPAS